MYYYLSAHGMLTNKTFLPEKNQTLIFFNLPGDIVTPNKIAPLLFDINTTTKKCYNTKISEKHKQCSGLSKEECHENQTCKSTTRKKKTKCVSMILSRKEVSEQVSPNLRP